MPSLLYQHERRRQTPLRPSLHAVQRVRRSTLSRKDRFPPATERHGPVQGELPPKLSARWPNWRLALVPPMAAYQMPDRQRLLGSNLAEPGIQAAPNAD